jgi:hypothetical protein
MQYIQMLDIYELFHNAFMSGYVYMSSQHSFKAVACRVHASWQEFYADHFETAKALHLVWLNIKVISNSDVKL